MLPSADLKKLAADIRAEAEKVDEQRLVKAAKLIRAGVALQVLKEKLHVAS